MTEVIQYLEAQIEEISAWLETPKDKHLVGDKQFVIGLSNRYTKAHGALCINPLKATRYKIEPAFVVARSTYDVKGNNFDVCVLRDAATKALYVIKETLTLLECVKSDISDNLRKV